MTYPHDTFAVELLEEVKELDLELANITKKYVKLGDELCLALNHISQLEDYIEYLESTVNGLSGIC